MVQASLRVLYARVGFLSESLEKTKVCLPCRLRVQWIRLVGTLGLFNWRFMEIPDSTICPRCHGDGQQADGSECATCGGTGQIPVEHLPPDSSG